MKKFRENFVNLDAISSIADEIFDQDVVLKMPEERIAPLRKFSAEQR
jgi:hypothetical protein